MSEEILIVDDNSDIRNIINELITDAGYKTRVAANYNQALAEIDKKLPDVAILDVKLDKGDNDGIELLSHIKSKNKDVPVIIISGHANIEMAVKSLQHGAFEFIEKPFDQERLLNFVKRAVENFNLKQQNKEYENKLFSSYELIGNSKNIANIIDQIKKISVTESRVFIRGPSGSGKELIARKIHKNSNRSKNSFIVLNKVALFACMLVPGGREMFGGHLRIAYCNHNSYLIFNILHVYCKFGSLMTMELTVSSQIQLSQRPLQRLHRLPHPPRSHSTWLHQLPHRVATYYRRFLFLGSARGHQKRIPNWH